MHKIENPKLAVVEDDLDIQDLICSFFREKKFQVKPYGDALELLRDMEKGEAFDAVITDLMLPHLNGIELTKKLRSIGNDTPIILITAHNSSERAIEAIEAGAYDFVVKPIHLPQLQVSVERALHFKVIRTENETLKTAVAIKDGLGIIGRSPGLAKAVDLAKRVSDSAANVFVTGETGAGKEVIAKAIHYFGSRAKHPFIAINCSAIPENLLESELFGHAKGSFTGASDKKIGLFEEAGEGTLFLDEIGDLTLPLQSKLLRVLQERRIRRIGENQFRAVNARIISATHKDLRAEVREHRFREDLFFRLNVIPIHLPPLRQRKEDILPLAEFFLKKFNALNGKKVQGFQKPVLEYLLRNPWLGNVRELENAIERAVVLCESTYLDVSDFLLDDGPNNSQESISTPTLEGKLASSPIINEGEPSSFRPASFFELTESSTSPLLSLEELINRYLIFALERNRGAKDKTARDLGIDRKTLYRRLQEIKETNALKESNAKRPPAEQGGATAGASQHFSH